MAQKGWYMVAYDIADPRRLKKVHGVLKKKGIAAQKSVFFVNGMEAWVDELLNELTSVMEPKADDLRAYPVIHPSKVWAFGPNPLSDFPVATFDAPKKISVKKQQSWFRMIFKIGLGLISRKDAGY